MASSVTQSKVEREDDENSESKDLERQPDNCDIDAGLTVPGCGGRQCSAGGLKTKRDDVAGDEDPVVELRSEA